MIRRLFDLCDKNRDGMLSLEEFNSYILDRQNADSKSYSRIEQVDLDAFQ